VRESSDGEEATFTLRVMPYQLYPHSGSEAEDKRAWYMREKHGGSAERQARYEMGMAAMGADVGIKFRFGGTMANTLPAHRIIQHFQEVNGPEMAVSIVDALYKRYFELEENPSSNETLVAACVEAGVDETEAKEVVADRDVGLAEVKNLIREQAMNGIDAVPYVIVEGRRRDLILIGAKEVDEYVKALRIVIKESK
jgi:predicted DsbA family dithiol-disulfide isomerase